MNKDELKREAFEWTEKNISVGISMYNPSIEMYCAKAYEDGARPREKQIEKLSTHVLELQKDKGDLIDENKRLKNEIEDLRGYCNQIKKIKTAIIKLFEKI